MAHGNDWFPTSRAEQLSLAKRWDAVLAAKPDGTTTNAETWGIPQAVVTTFHTQIGTADALLTTVEGPDATATIREECREAFALLEKLMRDLHWYFSKPDFPADVLVSLGLHIKDKHCPPVPVPVTQCLGEPSSRNGMGAACRAPSTVTSGMKTVRRDVSFLLNL